MKQYRAVIFDLDGTLMDTSIGVFQAIDFVTKRYQLKPLTEQEKRAFIGPPIQRSFARQYGLSESQAWEIAATWRKAYSEQFLFGAVPYPGIYDLLKDCRSQGIGTAVATNKREDYTYRLLHHFGFDVLFDRIIGSDMEGQRKKPEMLQSCVRSIGGGRPEDCLMVGDTTEDCNAATENGVDFLGVTYGFGFTKQTSHSEVSAVFLADSCAQIQKWLMEKR